VREIGCSNFSAQQLREARDAVRAGSAHFVSVQNEYSLLHREPERDVLEECARQGLAFLPYFPLACGLLTGKYIQGRPVPEGSRLAQNWASSRFLTEARLERVEALRRFAQVRNRSILELAVSWLLDQQAVASVIAGATSAEQVQANVAAAGWRLSSDELADIDRIVPATP
jgi:aryl-alcohol dehydrogenase-like predicted oxidoreductase